MVAGVTDLEAFVSWAGPFRQRERRGLSCRAGCLVNNATRPRPSHQVVQVLDSANGLAGQSLTSLIGTSLDVIAGATGADVCIIHARYSRSGTLAAGPARDQLTTASDAMTFASPGVGASMGTGAVAFRANCLAGMG